MITSPPRLRETLYAAFPSFWESFLGAFDDSVDIEPPDTSAEAIWRALGEDWNVISEDFLRAMYKLQEEYGVDVVPARRGVTYGSGSM